MIDHCGARRVAWPRPGLPGATMVFDKAVLMDGQHGQVRQRRAPPVDFDRRSPAPTRRIAMARRTEPPVMVGAIIDRVRHGVVETLIAKIPSSPYEGRWSFPNGPADPAERDCPIGRLNHPLNIKCRTNNPEGPPMH